MARKEPKAQPGEQAAVAVAEEPLYGSVETMADAELVRIHTELCSCEPPDCKRTFHPRDFRAHVLLLVAQKQKQIA